MRYGPAAQVVVAAALGVFTLALGLWAFFDTSSFYDEIAAFPPYNRHLLHDVGAFQIGLGVALIAAIAWRGDALLAVLVGAGAGATFHWVAHVVDEGHGGRSSDPYTLGAIAAVAVAAALWRWADRTRGRP